MPVYFIAVDEGERFVVKIGKAKDIQRRKRDLQTGNALELKLLGWIETPHPFEVERRLHRHFEVSQVRGEWFAIQPVDVLPMLLAAGRDGFLAKYEDAFEVVGYDMDAVPEYLGVWEWGDLEFSECCPFCGCLCGLHFQDASHMYHCLNCDTLTDFSDLERREDEP